MATVYLIGAGPGDVGLFTLKGKRILEQADVVIYDFLANPELLSFCRPDAEIIYVGKKGGDHTLPQDEINALIVQKAQEGRMVARLKGGDPYVFGRGGEEAEELVAAEVDFEVVPGVTAGVAAAAYAGIPVTHRAHTTSVCFITGHEDPTKEESGHNWDVYGKSNSTLVFYMGVKNLPMISQNLIRAGRSPQTPVALVQWGTRCNQRSMVSTLEHVAEEAKAKKFAAPSIIIVGGVCELHETLNWFEKKPLLGQGVVVTRSREQASDLTHVLTEMGACCLEFPTIAVMELEDTEAIEQTLESLEEFAWVVFTSVNGVEYFWRYLAQSGLDSRALGPCRVAAIGPATSEALVNHGIHPDFVPERFVAECVVQGMLELGVAGQKILIPRALKAREVLPEELQKAGAEVTVLPVYETTLAETDAAEFYARLEQGQIQFITFTSSSTVDNFFSLVEPDRLRPFAAAVQFACIGPVTEKTLEKYGFKAQIVPESYTIPALALALGLTVEAKSGS